MWMPRQIRSPASQGGDFFRSLDRIALADESLDDLAIIELQRSYSQRRRDSHHETSKIFQGNIPDFHFKRRAAAVPDEDCARFAHPLRVGNHVTPVFRCGPAGPPQPGSQFGELEIKRLDRKSVV